MSNTVTPEELETRLKEKDPPKIIDVRRRSDRASDPSGIPGAEWKDPEQVAEWGGNLGSREVVVYCVRGGSVSRSVQERLREKRDYWGRCYLHCITLNTRLDVGPTQRE